jgi:tocopherol cyclase
VQDAFQGLIEEGFQATETFHQGCITNKPGSCAGALPASVPYVYWAFTVKPVYGWGNAGELQQSTAGWLSALPVFGPHWQVLMAQGLATGYVQWGPDTRLDIVDAPMYSEKNWGASFPSKWAWIQCNTFKGEPHLALTGAAAIRNLLNIAGVEEEVGIIGVHYLGRFIEVSPANGKVRWDVEPWGRWHLWGKSSEYEAMVEAWCEADEGTILRAPLGRHGLVPACKDTFAGPPLALLLLASWCYCSFAMRHGL